MLTHLAFATLFFVAITVMIRVMALKMKQGQRATRCAGALVAAFATFAAFVLDLLERV
jgi:hypothetical protein